PRRSRPRASSSSASRVWEWVRSARPQRWVSPISTPAATRSAALPAPFEAPDPALTETVVVLDYGGQYSQLIARRVRECGVFSELLPHHAGAQAVARRKPRGVILSGGPASVYEDGAP